MSGVLAAAQGPRGKSPEAFRTISEVSFDLDVPQHVLRFWETRFSQVRPVKRAGGRRFYRPEDVALLRGIRALLYAEGYTIKGVQKVIRDKGWRHVADLGRALGGLVPWNEIGHGGEDDASDAPAETPNEIVTQDSRTREIAGGPNSAMAALLRAHADAAETVAMEEHKRVKLELLLAELLVLRDRLRTAKLAR